MSRAKVNRYPTRDRALIVGGGTAVVEYRWQIPPDAGIVDRDECARDAEWQVSWPAPLPIRTESSEA
ncbi:MAG: hypothetical protein WDO73_17305 [Ignavibacteriota bacterium]